MLSLNHDSVQPAWPLILTITAVIMWFFPAFSQADVNVSAVVPGVCGNDEQEVGEQCDGTDLNNNTCSTVGYDTGTLSCSGSCSFDVSSCEAADPPESPPSRGSSLPNATERERDTSAETEEEQRVTRVTLSGMAYAEARIRLLMNGERIQSGVSDASGRFEITSTDISSGLHSFYIIASKEGAAARTRNVTLRVSEGQVYLVDGLVIPPVIDDRTIFDERGLYVSGFTLPRTLVRLSVTGEAEADVVVQSNPDGEWSRSISLSGVNIDDQDGTVDIQAVMPYLGENFASDLFTTRLSTSTVEDSLVFVKGSDINRDGETNLVDFYIMQFWYLHPETIPPSHVDLNSDGEITLQDFSILANGWSG